MTFRTALVPLLAVVALSSIGCAAANDEPAAGSSESNQTASAWRITEIGSRPNHDIGENERVSFAIDAAGHRHAAYLSNDLKTHYIDFSTNQDIALDANQTSHAHLALDPQGQPHIAFSSDKGIAHASKKNGLWVVESIGVFGTADAIAVDGSGTVHIASDTTSAGGEWTATVSTLESGASAFQHASVPGKVAGEIGFSVNAFAVDRNGGEYLMLSSIEFVDDSTTSSHSTDEHAYFIRRPAGGSFAVEMMDKTLQNSAASLAIDALGNIHAVVAGPSGEADVSTAPYYIHRGPNDSAWSSPEKIHWDGYWTSTAVDSSGTVKVAISGDRASYGAYAERSSTGQWAINYVTTSDTQVPSLALDPAGKPVFAFRTYGGYAIAEPTN